MGASGNADFTALGDTVNKTFRLESATKQLRCDVVLGEGTLQLLIPPLPPNLLPPRGEVELKGYDAPEVVRMLRFTDLPRMRQLLTGDAIGG